MHLGHQRLLHELLEMATELRGTPTVVTFANHPDAVVAGRAPEPLISVPHRLRLLRRAGVQRLLLLNFDAGLQQMPAATFARRVLTDGLRTRGLLLGFDSAMGKDREGTPERFAELGQELGFAVRTGSPVEVGGHPVSSTAIRNAIAAGDLDLASRLLGRRPGAFGTVIQGHQRGRSLGFPTANIRPEDQVLPPRGVYAVEILHEGEQYLGVANLGLCPTFVETGTAAGAGTGTGTVTGEKPGGEVDAAPLSLEVHFLDCDLDLYGATLEVTFFQHLRDERKFAGTDELRAQIERDILAARRVLQP
jgi:riboflavin kinase/FMN adenylyltransferase